MQRTDKMQEAKRLYKKGEKLVDIAKQLDVPAGTVRRWKSVQNWDERSDNGSPNKKKVNKKEILTETESIVDNDNLNDKQKLFCAYYIRSFNVTKAYQKAYGCTYATAATNGHKLLKNAHIKAEIKKLKKSRLNREMLDTEDIFQKYIDIAFADITDYISFGSENVIDADTGENVVRNYVTFNDSKELDGTLISEISSIRGESKIRLADRMKALQWLSDYMDLEEDEEVADDGFIEALNTTAREDWEDEEKGD